MPTIDWDAILKKAQKRMSHGDMQKRIDDITDAVFLGSAARIKFAATNGGALPKPPEEAAATFIEVMKSEIESLGSTDGYEAGHLGATAVSALTKLNYGSPRKVAPGRYVIPVSFAEDLRRDSLAPDEYDGIDNIAALLNSGYTAGHIVYGIWLNHYPWNIPSLGRRDGAHFIESAIRNFMTNYASTYSVIGIDVDDVYK